MRDFIYGNEFLFLWIVRGGNLPFVVNNIVLSGVLFLIAFWVARKDTGILAPKNVSNAELYKQHISKEFIVCIVFMCLFALIGALGVINAVSFQPVFLRTDLDLWFPSRWQRLWHIIRGTPNLLPAIFSIPFSFGMIIFLAFKAVGHRQELRNGSSAEPVYRKHLSMEYIACIAFACYFGLHFIVDAFYAIPFLWYSPTDMMIHMSFPPLPTQNRLSFVIPLLLPILFSLGMFVFCTLKVIDYKQERKTNGIDAGLAYYKHISQKHIACIALVCLLGFGGVVSVVATISSLQIRGLIGGGIPFPFWLILRNVFATIPAQILIPLLFSLATAIFLAFKAKQYGKEKATMPEYAEMLETERQAEALKQAMATSGYATPDKVSYFDGRLIQFVGWGLLGIIVIPFSLGFAFPWWLCKIYGWKVKHTIVEGKRLRFAGTGMSLFGHWILWSFLTIITLGIYGWWLVVSVNKWLAKNTTFADAENESQATASTENLSYFDGRLIQFVGWGLLGIIVIPFSLGLALPWWLCKIYGWKVDHTIVEGRRLKFNGTGMSLFGHYILWSFLTIITLGIYGWWLVISVNKWLVKNTFFAEVPTA